MTLSLGTVALITRDKALIASENPPFGLLKKALMPINQGDALVKAKVHRGYCWDKLFLCSPQEAVEMVYHLVNSGFGLVIMGLGKAPNLSKIYKKPMMDNMIRAKDILDMQVPIRRCWYESQQSRLGNSVGESRFGAMASALLVGTSMVHCRHWACAVDNNTPPPSIWNYCAHTRCNIPNLTYISTTSLVLG